MYSYDSMSLAGMTSEGGGAVAFPVMTLVLGVHPSVARDFSVMVQVKTLTLIKHVTPAKRVVFTLLCFYLMVMVMVMVMVMASLE